MDPFTGLGSTAVACARLGVNFIGSDIDELYLEEAAERMEAAGNKPRAARPWRGENGESGADAPATASARRSARRA